MEKTQLDTANQLTAMSASQSDRLVLEAVLAGGLGLARRGRLDLPAGVVRPQGHQGPDRAERQRPRAWPTNDCRAWSSGCAGAMTWTWPRSRRPRPPAPSRGLRGSPSRSPPCRRAAVAAAVDQAQAAQGRQPGLPEHLHAQPVPAAPAARDAGLDGAADQRAGRARRPVPPRPPHHPHAPARRGPDHLVGRGARPRLARPGAGRGRPARRGGRGRGLRPGRRDQRVATTWWRGARSAT